jgi:hypothetical protein
MNIVVQQVDTAREIQSNKDATTDAKNLQAAQSAQEEKLSAQKVQESNEADTPKLNHRRHGEKRHRGNKKRKKKKGAAEQPNDALSASGKLLNTIA